MCGDAGADRIGGTTVAGGSTLDGSSRVCDRAVGGATIVHKRYFGSSPAPVSSLGGAASNNALITVFPQLITEFTDAKDFVSMYLLRCAVIRRPTTPSTLDAVGFCIPSAKYIAGCTTASVLFIVGIVLARASRLRNKLRTLGLSCDACLIVFVIVSKISGCTRVGAGAALLIRLRSA